MRVKIILVLIILIAALLRLWSLGSTPPSPDWDEAALAYNAYSIIETGRDEYGKFMPAILQSFDDYKPALYTYLAIPFILLFDVNTFAVRLPSAIFGILTVLAVYFLLKELFVNRGTKNFALDIGNFKLDIPLIATALLAISPWHIQFSRVAFETNVGLACNIFAALFFLKGLKKPWLLYLSVISMVFSIYVYQSEKVFVPLFALAMLIIYRKELFSLSKKQLIMPIIVGLILISPMLFSLVTDKNSLMRARGVSIFAEQTPVLRVNQIEYLDDNNSGNLLGQIFHNRRLVYAREMATAYLSHYNLNWYFIRGDIQRHHAPNMALLYLWELPFLFIGLYFLLFGPFSRRTKIFIFTWFLLAPVPASVTTGVPHAVRTLNFLPTFQIFTAIGLIVALSFVIKSSSHQVIKKFIIVCFLLFVIFNFVYYLNQYFVQQNYFNSEEWQYGYEQIMPDIKRAQDKYAKIIVTNQPPLDQTHMFFLFYLKYPPQEYQKAGNVTSGFRETHSFGRFEFRPIDWNKEDKSSNILYVGRPQDFPDTIKTIKQVNYLNGKPAIKLVEGQ
jgi:4-amino-4-deoxy-L-arabinose transferase-like glycosyltransferase